MEANRETSTETTLKIHEQYGGVFNEMGYFKGTFSL